MKLKKFAKLLAAFAVGMMMLVLPGCGEQSSESESLQPLVAELPENAKNEEGIVLDVSDGQFILRSIGGTEYVFRMRGAEDLTPEGTKPGQMVRAWYDGVLSGTNAANVKLLRIEPIEEAVRDMLSEDCVAQGIVTSVDEQALAIRTKDGTEHTFAAAESLRSIPDGAKPGQWVRIVFDGTPEMPVVKAVTLLAQEAESYIMTGALRNFDEAKKTLEIQADAGGVYEFSYENAEMTFPNGMKKWSRVDLVYTGHAQPKGAENNSAVLISAQPESKAKPRQIAVTVQNVTKNRGNLDVVTPDGRALKFYVDAKLTSGKNALAEGDVICIYYTGSIAAEQTGSARIVSVERLGLDNKRLFGTVKSMGTAELELQTNDGRTLTLKMPEGEMLPQTLKRGDDVCIRYTGVIVHDDAQNAQIKSISYFYE